MSYKIAGKCTKFGGIQKITALSMKNSEPIYLLRDE
jgi:hypothetical protein